VPDTAGSDVKTAKPWLATMRRHMMAQPTCCPRRGPLNALHRHARPSPSQLGGKKTTAAGKRRSMAPMVAQVGGGKQFRQRRLARKMLSGGIKSIFQTHRGFIMKTSSWHMPASLAIREPRRMRRRVFMMNPRCV